MEIVPNEWLLDCMRPDNRCYSISGRFLDLVETHGDRIVIRVNSPFTKKLARFSKAYPIQFRRLFWIMHDSAKVRLLNDQDILTLPENIAAAVPDDDRYPVELLFSTTDKVLITTDEPLKERIEGMGEFKVYLLDDFMRFYNRQHH